MSCDVGSHSDQLIPFFGVFLFHLSDDSLLPRADVTGVVWMRYWLVSAGRLHVETALTQLLSQSLASQSFLFPPVLFQPGAMTSSTRL